MTPRRRATARVSRLARAEAPVVRRATSTPLGQSPLADRVQARGIGAGRDLELPADVADDLLKGHLSQHCPDCGITEAAGGYCTKCDRRTGPADWFRQTRGRPVSGPQKTPENGLKRGPGRPRGHVDTGDLVTRSTADPNAGFWPA